MRSFFGNILMSEDNSIGINCYILDIGGKYGVEVTQSGGGNNGCSSTILCMGKCFEEIKEFARLVLKNQVMPSTLVDVASDYWS